MDNFSIRCILRFFYFINKDMISFQNETSFYFAQLYSYICLAAALRSVLNL